MNKVNLIMFFNMLETITKIICCTILAVLFNKWWIILVSVMFNATARIQIKSEEEEENE